MSKYSDNLIDITVYLFKTKYNLDISRETTIEYLDSLAGVYSVFADNLESK